MVPRDLRQWCQTFALIVKIFALAKHKAIYTYGAKEICTNGAKHLHLLPTYLH